MALRLIYADADKRIASSLAGFLKTQNVLVNIEQLGRVGGGQADDQIILWSRHFATGNQKFLKDIGQSIFVQLDKTQLPAAILDVNVVDAKAVGNRENVAWRNTVEIAKRKVSKTYDSVAITQTVLPKTVELELEPKLEPVLEPVPESALADISVALPDAAPEFVEIKKVELADTETSSPVEIETVPTFKEIAEAHQQEVSLPTQKVFLLPIIVLVLIILGLVGGVALVHPDSPLKLEKAGSLNSVD